MSDPAALEFDRVSKIYRTPAGNELAALRETSFRIPPGRVVSIVGRSGSGKSTLLHLAAGIDLPTRGTVAVEGEELARLSDRARTLLRRNRVGLVFQFFHLLSHLSVKENIALPELIAGSAEPEFQPRLKELLSAVGLADRADDRVEKLSGGEMQRVAVCRAMIRRPRLLLADEPTGNLDDENARLVMEMMLQLVRQEKATLVYVTHSREIASLGDETWRIHSGILECGRP